MPYHLDGNCVKKESGETVPGGCHDSHEKALAHLRALEANVKNSALVEMSMRIHKASYNKSDSHPMKWAAIDSDTDADLFKEKMSVELYKDFTDRIEKGTPIPDPFAEIICESDWCGGMPYVSIAHYKAGTGRVNVPGEITSVYIDGTRLKSKGTLDDTPMGRRVFDSLREDLYMEKSGNAEHDPVRISIGFLDLEHEHVPQGADGGQSYTFTRTDLGQICPLCSTGIGGKIYKKGQLIHLAMTRKPVNPRTRMIAEKSMGDEITTRLDDAKSIIGDLADGLEEKSIPDDILVVRSDAPATSPSPIEKCYDPNNGGWNNDCIASVFDKFMADCRDMIGTTVKSLVDEVVEEARRKDVSEADKKHAESEYGDVKYADETNKKYPIDTKEHVRAALSYWGMPKNRDKYSSADQKKIGGRIHAAAKKFGIGTSEKSDVEDTMDENTDKSVLGIPEKPFSFGGLDGNGNNTTSAPVTKAADDEEDAKDNAKDEKKEGEMEKADTMDEAYKSLKSIMANGGKVEDLQNAFNALGKEVEKSYVPPAPSADDIAAIVRSAVEGAVAPLKMEVATLKAQLAGAPAPTPGVVQSKALFNGLSNTNDPNALIKRAIPEAQQPVRQLSQIQKIARRSTGLQD